MEDLRLDLQSRREVEISKAEERKQEFAKIEEAKRMLSIHQQQVKDLEEIEASHHMNIAQQMEGLDSSFADKKMKLTEIADEMDSIQDEMTALKEEYEATKTKCAEQIASAKSAELDAKQSLENAKRLLENKPDLESLAKSEQAERDLIEEINAKKQTILSNYPFLSSINLSPDPNQSREAQIEESLYDLREFCRSKLDNAKAAFEARSQEAVRIAESHNHRREEEAALDPQVPKRQSKLSLSKMMRQKREKAIAVEMMEIDQSLERVDGMDSTESRSDSVIPFNINVDKDEIEWNDDGTESSGDIKIDLDNDPSKDESDDGADSNAYEISIGDIAAEKMEVAHDAEEHEIAAKREKEAILSCVETLFNGCNIHEVYTKDIYNSVSQSLKIPIKGKQKALIKGHLTKLVNELDSDDDEDDDEEQRNDISQSFSDQEVSFIDCATQFKPPLRKRVVIKTLLKAAFKEAVNPDLLQCFADCGEELSLLAARISDPEVIDMHQFFTNFMQKVGVNPEDQKAFGNRSIQVSFSIEQVKGENKLPVNRQKNGIYAIVEEIDGIKYILKFGCSFSGNRHGDYRLTPKQSFEVVHLLVGGWDEDEEAMKNEIFKCLANLVESTNMDISDEFKSFLSMIVNGGHEHGLLRSVAFRAIETFSTTKCHIQTHRRHNPQELFAGVSTKYYQETKEQVEANADILADNVERICQSRNLSSGMWRDRMGMFNVHASNISFNLKALFARDMYDINMYVGNYSKLKTRSKYITSRGDKMQIRPKFENKKVHLIDTRNKDLNEFIRKEFKDKEYLKRVRNESRNEVEFQKGATMLLELIIAKFFAQNNHPGTNIRSDIIGHVLDHRYGDPKKNLALIQNNGNWRSNEVQQFHDIIMFFHEDQLEEKIPKQGMNLKRISMGVPTRSVVQCKCFWSENLKPKINKGKKEMTYGDVINALGHLLRKLELVERHSNHFIIFGVGQHMLSTKHPGNLRVQELFRARLNEYTPCTNWGFSSTNLMLSKDPEAHATATLTKT